MQSEKLNNFKLNFEILKCGGLHEISGINVLMIHKFVRPGAIFGVGYWLLYYGEICLEEVLIALLVWRLHKQKICPDQS